MHFCKKKIKIATIGMGYVGLPLSVALSKKFSVIGFDTNIARIKELKNFEDKTLEITKKELISATKLSFTSNFKKISNCNVFIIAVPTPINNKKIPDLRSILQATRLVAKVIKKNDFIIYESTVYPGMTEEVCVPVVEKISKMKLNEDFFCGYSPERINPGDKKNKIKNIVKVTSGSNKYAREFVDKLYKSVIKAGTHSAPNIKTAEAAKVIENTQRDINISLMNELSIIFDRLKIDTKEVLKAAETKWNFLSFNPGLVGGHCIGVDPYYLTYKAKKVGIDPKVILSGRKVNDSMPGFVVEKLKRKMKEKNLKIKNSRILIIGYTFKENCRDIRNSQVSSIFNKIKKHTPNIHIYDSLVKLSDVPLKYRKNFITSIKKVKYDAVIVAVSHDYVKKLGIDRIKNSLKSESVIFDIKSIFKSNKTDLRL